MLPLSPQSMLESIKIMVNKRGHVIERFLLSILALNIDCGGRGSEYSVYLEMTKIFATDCLNFEIKESIVNSI